MAVIVGILRAYRVGKSRPDGIVETVRPELVEGRAILSTFVLRLAEALGP
jgi:hypothetical protein